MGRIYLPSEGTEGWRRLLADPVKHWRTGYSARCLAECWESAGGLPPEIAALLLALGDDPELLIAIPEHKVALPGSRRGESQSDLFALIRAGGRTAALTIEGKVNEPFDVCLGDWLKGASPGKLQRLAFIAELLGLEQPLPDDLHYQLLHRSASAIIEARRFKTDAAAMIVHSFSQRRKWFDAFARFVALFGETAEPGRLIAVRPMHSPPFHVGWATGHERFLREVVEQDPAESVQEQRQGNSRNSSASASVIHSPPSAVHSTPPAPARLLPSPDRSGSRAGRFDDQRR